jgi:hydrogenase expression/formation protein HypE
LLGVCTIYGTVKPDKLVTPGNAKHGDLIMCTKPVGIETLTNFALSHLKTATRIFGAKKVRELANMVKQQSCAIEAQQLAQAGCVNAMHDATEGGLITALNELSEASNVGMKVNWEKIPIPNEIATLKEWVNLNDEQVLALSSTGTILAAVPPALKQKTEEILKQQGLYAHFIGEFTENKKRILIKTEKEIAFPLTVEDAYTRLLSIKE